MVEASCRATTRSSSSANSAPCSGCPREKALRAGSWVWRMWSTPVRKRAEHLAVADDAADRDAAEIDAVIAALAADQAEARALADGALIGERDLEAGIDRLRAGVGEEDMVDAGRHVGDQARRQLEDLGMAHLEGRRVVELFHLVGDRLDDLRAAVAGIDAPQAGGAVQHLVAVAGAVIHALRADQHARRLLELPVGSERHPEGFEIVGRDLSARHDFPLRRRLP